jgi:hypothetical protein
MRCNAVLEPVGAQRINRLKRREFITLLGGAAVAPSMLWPLAARAQQAGTRRVGLLETSSPSSPALGDIAATAARLGLPGRKEHRL